MGSPIHRSASRLRKDRLNRGAASTSVQLCSSWEESSEGMSCGRHLFSGAPGRGLLASKKVGYMYYDGF